MNCQDAAEYLSALCDGETIPRAVAEHLGACATCRARLNNYLQMGAELRRMASLEQAQPLAERTWVKPRKRSTWFSKGWETMRIPKFAFALLLLAVAGLGSGLVIVRARAQSQGAVLMLTAKGSSGDTIMRCALSIQGKNNDSCSVFGSKLKIGVRVASLDGEEIKLGIRAQAEPNAPTAETQTFVEQTLEGIPEQFYSFRPGQKLNVEVPGLGRVVVTGDMLDHMPPLMYMNAKTDPDPNELQVVSPILLRGKKVLYDFEGGGATFPAVQMYVPDNGLWTFSLRPLDGALEAKVKENRASFELDGQSYTLVSGAPITRTERIWVLHNAKVPHDSHGFLGDATVPGQSHN